MILIAISLVLGTYVLITGPAFDDWHARRRQRRDFPAARVTFLLPSECRPGTDG